MNDYMIKDRQFYSDGRLLISFGLPTPTEFTLDGIKDGIPYPYANLFEKFRSNSVRIVPPSVETLKGIKKQFKENARLAKTSTIAIYLGDRETSRECKEYVKFNVDLLQKVLEMIPFAEMYLFSNFTDEYSGVYGAAYFKNEVGDEGILAPMDGKYFDMILMNDSGRLLSYEQYKRFERAGD